MTKGTGKEPRMTGDLYALVDPDERDHALDALREGMPADAMADTVERLIVVPLLDWIDDEYRRTMSAREKHVERLKLLGWIDDECRRTDGHHTGTEAGMQFLTAAEEIVCRCRHDLEVYPEHFDALRERWTDWLAAMAQGTAALQWGAQAGKDSSRKTGGKNRAGKESPFTMTVRAMVKALASTTPDKMAATLRAEMLADAEGRESVLAGIRESGLPCVRFVNVEVENFSFVDANGKTGTRAFGTLENAITKAKKRIRMTCPDML